MNCMFKVGKTYKTVDGGDVTIVYIDDRLYNPVVGVVTTNSKEIPFICSWSLYGVHPVFSKHNLLLPKPKQVTMYVNVYKHRDDNLGYHGYVHRLLSVANKAASPNSDVMEGDFIGTFPFSFEVNGDE